MTDVDETRRALCAFETDGAPGRPGRRRGRGRRRRRRPERRRRARRVPRRRLLHRRAARPHARPPPGGDAPASRCSPAGTRRSRERSPTPATRPGSEGLLAHGLGTPERFDGAVLEPGPARDARLLVWPTHVTVVPAGADPFQVPLGTVDGRLLRRGDLGRASSATASGGVHVGRLARRTDAFARAVREARAAMLERCARASGTTLFADGRPVPADDLGDEFDRLLAAWSARERLDGAREIVGARRPRRRRPRPRRAPRPRRGEPRGEGGAAGEHRGIPPGHDRGTRRPRAPLGTLSRDLRLPRRAGRNRRRPRRPPLPAARPRAHRRGNARPRGPPVPARAPATRAAPAAPGGDGGPRDPRRTLARSPREGAEVAANLGATAADFP